jgi:ATP-dependent DNA helicase RecQ
MFSDDGVPREFVCQRLRSEIRYYSRLFDDKSQRDAAVMESLWHLPRPAILYVTEKASADDFVARLQAEGFTRVAGFHGDTRKTERRSILDRWKKNEIDLIVATSAFGVGVDKRDVRAVVHACYPENLDRYYQEVGRSGRDGWSSVSLLLASPRDREVAEGITVSLMTPELIQERWAAMFEKAEPRDEYVYALPVTARRVGLVGTRTYRENIRWNKRLLLQLERAGQLKLLDIELRPAEQIDEEPEEWVIVKIAFVPRTPRLSDLIAAQRNEEVAYFRSGLKKLDEFLAGANCAARVIGNLYGIDSHQRGCPGCPLCRRRNRSPGECEPLDYPKAIPATQLAKSELIEKCPDPRGLAGRSDFIDAISRCVASKGLKHFFCPEPQFGGVLNCFKEAFPINAHELHRIDRILPLSKLSAVAGLPAVFLHVGSISSEALEVGRGHPAVHLLCGVQNPDDHNGRHVAVNENFRRWPTFESWITEEPNNSLPCLPMTL